MKRPQYIQINIPSPCSQNWDEMAPTGSGRHCTRCSTTVIDFSTWTDAELYKFFAGNKAHVCGRYLSTQVGRPIHIPPQPHSRLYKMVVAMGLTLIFMGVYEGKAQGKVLLLQGDTIKSISVSGAWKIGATGNTRIKGTVTDKTKEPIINASVAIYMNDTLRGGALTDLDGNYLIDSIPSGSYQIRIWYVGYKKYSAECIVTDDAFKTVDIRLTADKSLRKKVVVHNYGKTVICKNR